jgi:predicted phosphodiesterase
MGMAVVPQAVVAALWCLGLTAHQAANAASQPALGLTTRATAPIGEDANSADTEPLPAMVKGPYLLWPASDSMTIAWETDLPADSRLDSGPATPYEFSMEDPNLVTLHRMTLTGLQPSTTYVFRAGSGTTLGYDGSFKTAPTRDSSFRFAVYGDTHSDANEHAAVVQSMMGSHPAVVFHCGDLVEIGRDYATWQSEFFEPARPLMVTTPLVPVPGNHEYFGMGPLWFFYFFAPPSEGGWWAMTYGDVRFIGLNTNLDYAPGSEQYQWFLAELESSEFSQALWHVVLFHHPPYTCTDVHQDNLAVQAYLVPLFDQYGVQLVFSGHSHAYERYSRRGITYIVTGGGGGSPYRLVDDTVPPIRQFGASVHHHCIVDVNVPDQVLRLKAVDPNGQVFDSIEVVGSAPVTHPNPE